jgi:23S rRNA (cytosine1962-C5)-methyltransferase
MYPELILKPGRERSVYNRHPWLFSGAVKKLPAAAEGDIIRIVSSDGRTLAYGFYSSLSQIVCRMFEFSVDEHFVANRSYWQHKIENAYKVRKQPGLIGTSTDVYRLLHAEGDFMPGIICDIYGDLASVQILIRGTEQIKDVLLDVIREVSGIKHIYLKTKKSSSVIEQVEAGSSWINPPDEKTLVVTENDLKFYVDVETGQKTGFFIDQRDNRQLLRSLSNGKKVLNCFSYTGGFSVYAMAGGASLVHSIDSSKEACRLADDNMKLNFPSSDTHTSFAVDCFEFIRESEESYDIVILDPPAFAKSARAVENAARGYKELNMAAIKKIKSGGLIFTFSCSQNIDKDLFRKIVYSAAADARRNVRILSQLSQPSDHPINIFHPEGEYLKGLLIRVE